MVSPVKRTTGMDESVIRDPAHAIAAGKCWLARRFSAIPGTSIVADHPDECSWCEFDYGFIIDKIEEFQQWAGIIPPTSINYNDPEVRPMRAPMEAFLMLPDHEQKRLVRQAQGFESTGLVPDDPDIERPADLYRH